MQMPSIKIYTKTACRSCRELKSWFDVHEVNFEEVNLDNDAERMDFFKSNGVKTVPQLYIGDERIGGIDAFLDREEEIKEKLNVTFSFV